MWPSIFLAVLPCPQFKTTLQHPATILILFTEHLDSILFFLAILCSKTWRTGSWKLDVGQCCANALDLALLCGKIPHVLVNAGFVARLGGRPKAVLHQSQKLRMSERNKRHWLINFCSACSSWSRWMSWPKLTRIFSQEAFFKLLWSLLICFARSAPSWSNLL